MEDFRIRVQRFFSNTKTVISVSVLCFFLLMIVSNFLGTFVINSIDSLRICLQSGGLSSHHLNVSLPNPFHFSHRLKWLYVICGIFSMIVSVRTGYRLKKNLSPLSNAKTKGSRHFASIMELDSEYRSVPEKSSMYDGKGGFPIARYKERIFIDDSAVHNLVIGTTRSGKGEIFIIPAIDIYSRAKHPIDRASMILADPKGELACASKDILEQRGYHVYIFDLLSFMGMSSIPYSL